MQNDFSFDGVERAMLEQIGDALQSETPAENLEKARQLQAHFEQMRLDNIAAYDRDGLMPFERQAMSSRLGED